MESEMFSRCSRKVSVLKPLECSCALPLLWTLVLTLSYFRTKSQNRCDSCTYIYVHGLCDQRMGHEAVSNGHFMVSVAWAVHVPRSAGSHYSACLPSGRKLEFNRSYPLFSASFGKLRLSDQVQFIAWHGIQRQIIWIFCRESEVSG